MKDFAPISRIGSYTLLLVVNPDVPAKSVAELIAYAKANPGKLTFASGNTSGIVAGETLKRWAGSTSCTCRTRACRRRSTTCWGAACR